MNEIQKLALKDSLLTALYIAGVAGFMTAAESLKIGNTKSIVGPIAFLSLFVLSASVTGFLMFGKPVQLYMDGKKKEAVSLVTYTLIYFAVITVIALVSLVFISH